MLKEGILMKELLLNSEVNVGFIAETEDILEIVNDLLEDGITIYFDEEKEIEDIIEDNDILQLTKIICEDCGKVKYCIEEVFDEDGYTIPDDSLEITYIDESLLDCIEYTALDTEIVPVSFEYEDEESECNGDCDNCPYSDDEELEDGETMGEALAQELFESLSEVDKDDFETMYELIVNKLQEAYDCAKMDALAELSDAVDAIKVLK
jgi:hypothetical protein